MNELLKTLRPLMSVPMRSSSRELPDDAEVRLSINHRNGYTRSITLGELRELWTAYETALAEQPTEQPTKRPITPGLTVSAVELHTQKSERLIMPDMYKLIFYLNGNAPQTLAAIIPQNAHAAALAATLHHIADQLKPPQT